MSEDDTSDVTWEEIAESWRLEELLDGRMRPTTGQDMTTLMMIGALRGQRPPLSEAARCKALDRMLAAADSGAQAEEDQRTRSPARVEQTRQEMLRALGETHREREE
ncbi:hypothetical protein [Streptomyces sp. NPDC059611]|uniref:hypothetical protein n=1 Tax=Streptomyces sp. NPDC059611 TaxID=3346884 RepID=UPI0036B88DC2